MFAKLTSGDPEDKTLQEYLQSDIIKEGWKLAPMLLLLESAAIIAGLIIIRKKEQNMSKEGNKSASNKKLILIIVIMAALLLVMGGFLIYNQMNKDTETGNFSTAGSVDADTSEWDDGLSAPSEIENQILVPGYSGAKMQAGDTVLALRIGNPEENTCYLQATLKLEDGTVLFESGLIEPGKGYEEIELTQTLEAGSYKAFVHYQGYSMDEEPQILNSCDSAFTLNVSE